MNGERPGLSPELCVRLWNARKPMTHDQIAIVLGLSRSRVWQIEQRALRKIRKAVTQRLEIVR